MYGALFMKLWRINGVLQCSRPRSKVAVKHVVWPFATLLSISVVVLNVWTAVDPYQWVREPVDPSDPQGESYGQHLRAPDDLHTPAGYDSTRRDRSDGMDGLEDQRH